MDLPPIPEQDWREHQRALFKERATALTAPFEEQERAKAYRAEQSALFQQSSQALEQDFVQRTTQQEQATFAQSAQSVEQDFLKRTAPPPAPAGREPQAPAMPTGGPATTVDLGQGKIAGRSANESEALSRVYSDALKAGLGEEGARAAAAIARTEGGYGGAVGDLAGGGSFGTYQLYAQGQLPNFAAAIGTTVENAKKILAADPHAANAWAFASYLGGAIKEGLRRGLSGPDLATFAQRTGQVSVSPERAGANYQALYGPGGAQQPPIPPTKAIPDTQTQFGASSEELPEFQGQSNLFDATARYLGPQAPLPVAPRALSSQDAAPGVVSADITPGAVVQGLGQGLADTVQEGFRGLNTVGVGLQQATRQLPGGDWLVDTLQEAGRKNPYLSRPPDEGPYPGSLPATPERFGEAGVEAALAFTPASIEQVGGKALGAAGAKIAASEPVQTAMTDLLREAGKPRAPIPHPEFLQPEALLPPQTVAPLRRIFDRSRNVIASMGEAGQELAGRVHAWREGAETDAAAYLQRMPTVKTLGSKDFVNLVDVLEGNAAPSSPRIAQAAQEAKGVLDDLFTRAQNAGVEVAGKIEQYFPHVLKEDVVSAIRNTKKRGDLIRRLMESNQAATPEEANTILQRYVTASRDRRHGALEMERLANLGDYRKEKEVLYNHVLTASRRINEVAQFGRDDAIANRLLERIGAEGYELPVARDLFQTIVGAKSHDDLIRRISTAARAYNTATRLGLAVLGNATQSVNTASVTGLLRTVQNAPKAVWSRKEKEFADTAGVVLDAVIRETREGSGLSDKIPGLTMLGFGAVETFNRRLAAVAGREFAADMARKAAAGSSQARRSLSKMGLDAEGIAKRGKLSAQEEIRAARSIVERTQFRVDPQDLPGWTSHPVGQLVSQFKTFSYNQTAFVKRELLDEAVKGNVLPLLRFAVLAPIAQAAATEARNLAQGRAPEEDPGMRALQYAMGPLGVGGDVARTLFGINSKYVPVERRVSQFTGSLLGPTVGQATEALGGVLHATEGNLVPAERLGLRQVPYVGGYLANTLTPYKQPSTAVVGERTTTGAPRPPAPPRPPRPPRR